MAESPLRTFLEHPARPEGTLLYHELQGFLFARPMPADMLLAWVEGRKPAGAADFSPSVRDASFSV